MTQQASDITKEAQEPLPPRLPLKKHFSLSSIFIFSTFVLLLLLLFTSLLIGSLPDITTMQPTVIKPEPVLQASGGKSLKALTLSSGQELIYAQPKHIYAVPVAGGRPRELVTPGYSYNRALPVLLAPDGKVLYSGNGIWLTDPVAGHPEQLVSLPADRVMTSLVLSSDGSTLAWSSAPLDRNGDIELYAGPLMHSRLVYQQAASQCPCFRVFSFAHDGGVQANTRLLLTNDRGDHRAVRYGLWSFNLAQGATAQPQELLADDPLQGPLSYAPQGNLLLYSTYKGFVPAPVDRSIPNDINALSYANSLVVAHLSGEPLQLAEPYTLLAAQRQQKNSASYHWVTTPRFTADGQLLLYLEFSSDAHDPFARHSALYTVQMNELGHGPKLVATSTARYIELGGWLNEHTLTFYADNALYAVDVQQGSFTRIASTSEYAHIVGAVK